MQRAVILIVQNSPNNCVGLLLNRESPLTVADLHACEASRECFATSPVHIGGCYSTANLLVLHGQPEVTDAHCVCPGLYTGGLRTACAHIKARQSKKEDFCLLAGYQAWEPGQLEAEMKIGFWLPVSASPTLVLDVARGSGSRALTWHHLFSYVSVPDPL
jgi:putative AlgH/UPF0301 family transcriptional regulator